VKTGVLMDPSCALKRAVVCSTAADWAVSVEMELVFAAGARSSTPVANEVSSDSLFFSASLAAAVVTNGAEDEASAARSAATQTATRTLGWRRSTTGALRTSGGTRSVKQPLGVEAAAVGCSP
jgi:hypothetical protein